MKYLSLIVTLASINQLVTAAIDDKAVLVEGSEEHQRKLLEVCAAVLPQTPGISCSCSIELDPAIVAKSSCGFENPLCSVVACGTPFYEFTFDVSKLLRGEGTPFEGNACFGGLTLLNAINVETVLGPLCLDFGKGITDIATGAGFNLGTWVPAIGNAQNTISNIVGTVQTVGIQGIAQLVLAMISSETLNEEAGMKLIQGICSQARIGEESCNSCTGCLSEDGEFGVNFDCTNIDSSIISTSCGAVNNVPMKIADVANFENVWVPQFDELET